MESNTLKLKENWGLCGRLEGHDMDVNITSGHEHYDIDLNHRIIKLSLRGWKINNMSTVNHDHIISIELKLIRERFVCPICWSPKTRIDNDGTLTCSKCGFQWQDPKKMEKK